MQERYLINWDLVCKPNIEGGLGFGRIFFFFGGGELGRRGIDPFKDVALQIS